MYIYWLTAVGVLIVITVDGTSLFANQSKVDPYDVEQIINELGLQFCTIVEIGQGICSLFLEIRDAADSEELRQGSVAEVFMGECQCSSLREWSLCNPRLIEARGETCRFKEATGRDPTAQRVHRRLCDFDHIITAGNRPCDCEKRLDDMPSYRVNGLGTCYRTPQPESVCGRHSVCGVYACESATVEGYTMVQCDKRCKGKQPFCEDPLGKPPTITSYWSEWTPSILIGFEAARSSEASCLAANTRAPAFDCLGPGPYCCPPDDDSCFCDVEYTITGKKVRRYTNIDPHINMVRSVNKSIGEKALWKRLLSLAELYQKGLNDVIQEEKVRRKKEEKLESKAEAHCHNNELRVKTTQSRGCNNI